MEEQPTHHRLKINTTYFKLKERHIYGSSRVGVRNSDLDVLPLPGKNFSMTTVHYSIGSRTYELSNHLGNVLSVISDKVIPVFPYSNVISEMLADIRVAQDYSPFGVTLDGRNFVVNGGYRYGYQGSESDDEVKGEGNSYTTHFRQLDPRLGRWLSIDPKASLMPWQSPYCSMDNNPIIKADEYGDTTKFKIIGSDKFEIINDPSNYREVDIAQQDLNELKKSFTEKEDKVTDWTKFNTLFERMGLGTLGYSVALETRKLINSDIYDKEKKKGNFGKGKNKCNQLVYDVMVTVDVMDELPNDKWPPQAQVYTSNAKMIYTNAELIMVSDAPRLGDIIAGSANYNGATGHLEVVTHIFADGSFVTSGVHSNGKVNQTRYGENIYKGKVKTYIKVAVRRASPKIN